MEFIVGASHLTADIATALDVQGREHLVIVAKASWRIPEAGQRPQPIAPQPLAAVDLFLGEPGKSPMLYGADFARFKPQCDVLFNASAHSPDGKPLRELIVLWQVAALQKALRVTGPRQWWRSLGGARLTEPVPFSQMPLHFGLAFGGTHSYIKGNGAHQKTLVDAFPSNPDGIGWAGPHTQDQIDDLPAPCLEGLNDPVTRPRGKNRPMAFSAIGRNWTPRKDFAGTYDARWQEEVFPLLPDDFDERYHQCAPEDQQMPYPKGGEPVILKNMLAGRPDVRFALPRLDQLKIRVLRTDLGVAEPDVAVDTLYFEPDAGRFSAVWRASVPIRRGIREFDTIAVGPVDPVWWDRKRMGTDTGCGTCNDDDDHGGDGGGRANVPGTTQ